MKKLGFITLALVVALGAVGVGYAMWSDSIVIRGDVDTGDVDIVIEDTSNTLVFKDPAAVNEITVVHYWDSEGQPTGPAGSTLVAWADADWAGGTAPPTPLPGDDEIYVNFWNMFPCVTFEADFLVHYIGSIPVKVKVDNIVCDNTLINPLMRVVAYKSNAAGERVDFDPSTPEIIDPIPSLEGYQLHRSDRIIIVIVIHIPQTVEDPGLRYMNQNGQITGSIVVQQWNEYQ
jgi:hypothetical protein